jgi:hypothetical protein
MAQKESEVCDQDLVGLVFSKVRCKFVRSGLQMAGPAVGGGSEQVCGGAVSGDGAVL